MKRSTLGTATLVAVVSLAVAATPASAVSKAEKKQNSAIKKQGAAVKKLTKRNKSVSRQLGLVAGNLSALTTDVKAIQAGIPQVVSSLSTLGAGLTTLSNSFKGYVGAAEYGLVQLYVGTTEVPGQLLISSDIPDDANQATVAGKLFAGVPAGTTNVPLILKAAVRSGEKDGTGASNPVAHAGLMSMTANGYGATVSGGNPGTPGDVPITSKANSSANGAPVYPIPDKAPRSDPTPNPFAFPSDKSIELTDPTTLQTLTAPPDRFKVSNPGSSPGIVVVEVTVRFNDLSASATDLQE